MPLWQQLVASSTLGLSTVENGLSYFLSSHTDCSYLDSWADNFLASSESQDVSKCAMTCSGDKSQFCGAANSLLVYKSDSVGAAVVPSGNGFTYQSCWSDSASKTRTLTRRIDLPQMTVEKCLAACAANKAVLCGLEYGQEVRMHNAQAGSNGSLVVIQCWMSTDSTLTGSALPAESCSMTCIGSAGTQFCECMLHSYLAFC